MDWILILIALVAIYAIAAYYIHSRKLWADHIVFYGPIMAIKTNRVKFFDKFTALRTFFQDLRDDRGHRGYPRFGLYHCDALPLDPVHAYDQARANRDL